MFIQAPPPDAILVSKRCTSNWLELVQICSNLSKLVQTCLNMFNFFFQAPRLTSLQRQEDLRRMSKALQNLKKYTDSLIHGKSRCAGYSSTGQAQDNFKNLELCWDSWDQSTPAVNRVPPRNYHDPKHHRNNHIVSSTRRDESASPKQVSLDHICKVQLL